jgi:hypothetical protein
MFEGKPHIRRVFETEKDLKNFINAFYLLYDYYPIVEIKGWFKNKLTQEIVSFEFDTIKHPVHDYGIIASDGLVYVCDGECKAKLYYRNALD